MPGLSNFVNVNAMAEKKYINRDISWLSFNYRVLQEALDPGLPLYERIKFMAIYSSNLEEFFRVRVGTIRSLLDVLEEAEQAEELLREIYEVVNLQQQEFGTIFRERIIPELERNHIFLIRDGNFSREQEKYIRQFFEEELMYQLQPLLLVKNKVAPFLQNGAIYLIVCLMSKSRRQDKAKKKRMKYAMVRIPSDTVSRFLELPKDGENYGIAFLDDIIKMNLDKVFRGYEIKAAYSVKLSRDADLHIEDEFQGNLVEKVKKSLSKRKTGAPSRFLYDEAMPPGVVDFAKSAFNLKKNELIPGGKYHNFFDFFRFPNPLSPQLEAFIPPPMRLPEFDGYPSVFEAIKTRDWLLHFPYQSYDYVLRYLNEAAFDPKVFEIKATQYRVASESAIVTALITAARNGKDVTVFVEVKARFDEEVNMRFAQQMAAAGVKVIYSLPGLKVHAKAILVSRRSGNRKGVRQYAYLSTGNFNEKTAKLYSDHGFFTARPEICDDLTHFFRFLENQKKDIEFSNILVTKFNMVKTIDKMIGREIKAAKKGKPAHIFVKVNNLEDPKMIDKLYKASQAGVKVDIIVRSICCLVPDKAFSRNITVRRIVDMYLEHARILMFHNGGRQDIYFSSADWMSRNLYHRIELAFPLTDPILRQEMLDIVDLQLRDNTKARLLDSKLNNLRVEESPAEPVRAQTAIYEYLKEKYFKVFHDD